MKYRRPARINRDISTVGFGAWQLGNLEMWGDMDEAEAIQLVRQAVAEGVNLFDTAPGYGGGESERLLGVALEGVRDKVFINTKFGHTVDNRMDFTVAGLDKSLQGSLARLRTTYVDGLILHNPGIELLYGEGPLYDRLRELKTAGVIRHYGVSIDSREELDVVLQHNDVDIIELMFNIIHQRPRELFEEVRKRGILLMIKVPLDSGWLTGRYTKDTAFSGIRARWSEDVKATRHDIVLRIKQIVGTADLVHTALRYCLSYPAVTAVIPGTRNTRQLTSNVAAAEGTLSEAMKRQLELLWEDYIQYQHTPW